MSALSIRVASAWPKRARTEGDAIGPASQPNIGQVSGLSKRRERPAPRLFLCDVTSRYLEGRCTELGGGGHNRDGRRGRKQVVAGRLTDEDRRPRSIELFRGNTRDPAMAAGIDRPAMLPALRRAAPGPGTRRKLLPQRRTRRLTKATVNTNANLPAEP